MFDFNLGNLIGLIGFCLSMFAIYQLDHKRILIFSFISAVVWTVHYTLIGSAMTAIMVALITVRIGFAYYFPKNYYLMTIFLLLGCVAFISMYQSYNNIFSIFAYTLGTIAYFKLSGIPMRIAFISASLAMAMNAYIIGSAPGAIIEIIAMGLNLRAIYVYHKIDKS